MDAQHYTWHQDSWNKPYDRPKNFEHGLIRKLSVTLSLADGNSYEGGDLEFDMRNNGDSTSNIQRPEIVRNKGTIVVFPSFVWHRVTPVTKGTRYSLVVWNLGLPKKLIVEKPSKEKRNIIVFNHRAAAYKGYPRFIELMREYRKRRDDFTVWVPQLVGKSPETWIDNSKSPKHEYYERLQQCKVGVQMRQTNYGWSVSGTDCLMNGTPMIWQESDCYREIDPNGMFFKKKTEFFD